MISLKGIKVVLVRISIGQSLHEPDLIWEVQIAANGPSFVQTPNEECVEGMFFGLCGQIRSMIRAWAEISRAGGSVRCLARRNDGVSAFFIIYLELQGLLNFSLLLYDVLFETC